MAQTVKRLSVMWETRVWSLGREVPLEKGMATHSSILVWRIPRTEEPGRLQYSMGSQRVRHDWVTSLSFLSFYKNRGLLGGSVVKNPPATQETQVPSLGWEDPLEEEMATHSRILAWEIPWTEEPGGLQSMGSQRVGHNWSNWAEQQNKNKIFLPGPSRDGQSTETRSRASLRVCLGLCGAQTHTKIIYTLAHRGGSLLGTCLWLTPFRLPGNISSRLLPCVPETEFNLVVCEVCLFPRPRWAKLGGTGRN